MINIEEIIIVNSAGALMLFILLLFRTEKKGTKHLSARLFDAMIWLTLGALIVETFTFLLDGKPGKLIHILLYLLNGYLFFASGTVGMLWFLYVDQRIYHSLKRLRTFLIPALIPNLLVICLLVIDMFGAGNIFYITENNIYSRGRLVILTYLVLYIYYASSIILSVVAVKKRGHVQAFFAHYFILPCVVGTAVQGFCYGLSVGWFCVSHAFLFSQMQLQHQNVFVDDLSGLYNRKYYSYFISQVVNSKKHKTISGIMLDVNHFKSINDRFGHTTGDDAIRCLGKILSMATTERNTVFRLAGDEFIVISVDVKEYETIQLVNTIHRQIEQFNESAGKPFKLSVSMGYILCETADLDSDDFLQGMDMKMYHAKAEYYSQADHNRRKSEL